jgi:hypothetical protein
LRYRCEFVGSLPCEATTTTRSPSAMSNSGATRGRPLCLPVVVSRQIGTPLRHTAASLAVSAGANVKAVQRMLGHASAAMTLDRYADLFDDLDAVAERLDAVARASGVSQTCPEAEIVDLDPAIRNARGQ